MEKYFVSLAGCGFDKIPVISEQVGKNIENATGGMYICQEEIPFKREPIKSVDDFYQYLNEEKEITRIANLEYYFKNYNLFKIILKDKIDENKQYIIYKRSALIPQYFDFPPETLLENGETPETIYIHSIEMVAKPGEKHPGENE